MFLSFSPMTHHFPLIWFPPITFNFQIFYQVSIFVPVFSKMPNAKRNARETPTLEIKTMSHQVFWQNVHVKVKIVFGLLEKQSNQICSALVSIAGHFWPIGHFWAIHFHGHLFCSSKFELRPSKFCQNRPLLWRSTLNHKPPLWTKTVHFRPIHFH